METDYFTKARAGRSLVSSLEDIARHDEGHWVYTDNGWRTSHAITEEQAEQFKTDRLATENN